jgi:hypothetical protein
MSEIVVYRKRKETLKKWDLTYNPFSGRPPEPRLLSQIFTGREREMSLAMPTVLEVPRNLLIYGVFGVGKTVFILETLRKLKEIDNPLVIYTSLIGDTPLDLAKTVLLGLANSLMAEEEEAKRILESAVGIEKAKSMKEQIYSDVKAGIPLLSVKGGVQSAITTTEQVRIEEPRHHINKLLELADRKYERIIIAVDDIEKKEPNAVRRILVEARDILFSNCSFILTGHPLGVTRDIYTSALRVFDKKIELKPLLSTELRKIVVNYLNIARKEKSEEIKPFTEEVLSWIIEKSYGIPGVLNSICFRVLDAGATAGFKEIGENELPKITEEVEKDIYLEITPEVRYILEVLGESGGLSEDTSLEVLDRLKVHTFMEAIPIVENLVQNDLLVKLEDERGIKYVLNPLAEKIIPSKSKRR